MTAPEQYIEITTPLPGEMPEDYCGGCELALVMHPDGLPCPGAGTLVVADDHAHVLELVEVRMSDCEFGCKIWRRPCCGEELLIHSATYGCRGGSA